MSKHSALTFSPAQSEIDEPRLIWARKWVRLLDDYYLDGLIGLFVPAGGDAITGVGSMALLLTALRERVPTIILFRMVLNIAIDVGVGGDSPFGRRI